MTSSISDIASEIPSTEASTSVDVTATPTETNGVAPGAPRDGAAMVLVPAGFIGDLLGSLSGTIGQVTGGLLGNATFGRHVGELAGEAATLLPFQVVPPGPTSETNGSGEASTAGHEPMIVVPNAFLGGILGGIGGSLLGGTIGGWLGSEQVGESIGSTVGGAVGGLLPFQVVPPEQMPPGSGSGPDGAATVEDAMIVVPAGFFGDVLAGVAGTVGDLVGGKSGRQVGEAAAPFIRELFPFQAVPPQLAPQASGPGVAQEQMQMTVVPAGFFGGLLSNMAESIGGAVGGLFGSASTGKAVGGAAAPILNMLPFHAVPQGALSPASAGPASHPQEQMLFVPAGLLGSMLSCWGGTVGREIGGWLGDEKTGATIGSYAGKLGDLLPFSVLPPARD